ncbi:MAG: hypothetical protein EOP43_01795 [Sphingobacteriaceae bacterium]|nr:MAG: hypothetical protein EOP43_01795 [Sphingobacteriaceae bacterium]
MDGLENLEMMPTGEQRITEIAEHSQLLRNYYETGDPAANPELLHLLVLKHVSNEQIRETIREVMLMGSTTGPNAAL